jgi:hypothetical protein
LFLQLFRNKIGRIDKTPSRTPDSILLPPGGNGKLYGLVAVKDSCPTDGKKRFGNQLNIFILFSE